MVNSIASCVKQIINRSPFINEMLIQDVISYANLSENIKAKVEVLYDGKVNAGAIVMAIRRYAEELRENNKISKKTNINYEINIKTNIYDVNFVRDDNFIKKLPKLYEEVKIGKGDFLNISIGSHEISLAVSEKFKDKVNALLSNEKILDSREHLVSLTISFSDGFLQTPGILYMATRKLAWENINLIEIVSTMNELTFVIESKDSMKAFEVLQSFFDEEI